MKIRRYQKKQDNIEKNNEREIKITLRFKIKKWK